jgi:hypothetical protein
VIGEVYKTIDMPQIIPLLDSKLRPLGTSGEISQLVSAPPPGDTVFGAIAWLSVKSISIGLYVKDPGVTSLMVMVTVVEDDPPELLAQIV